MVRGSIVTRSFAPLPSRIRISQRPNSRPDPQSHTFHDAHASAVQELTEETMRASQGAQEKRDFVAR
jgi:hypothetical protein